MIADLKKGPLAVKFRMTNLSFLKPNSKSANFPLFCWEVGADYFALLKPRVMSLVVFTGGCGLLMAPGTLSFFTAFFAIFCIAVGAGAAGCLNMWYDRDIDQIMSRTKNRPLPRGRISPNGALIFGTSLAVFSVILMAVTVHKTASFYLALTIVFYVVVYTMWLKRSTVQNIVIGGAAGAFPPLIGWVSVTETACLEAWILFAIIFMWTPPHFWALALYRHDDYRQANVPMLPVVRGADVTKRYILFYTLLMVVTTLLPWWVSMASWAYLVLALLLGGVFIFLSLKVWLRGTASQSMKLFGYSILYLFLLYLGLTLDRLFIL